jgi:hypothetical protein
MYCHGEEQMRIVNICAVVIAASTFATAVESVYGWGKVAPLAEQAWTTTYEWGSGLAGRVAQPPAEGGTAGSEGKKS